VTQTTATVTAPATTTVPPTTSSTAPPPAATETTASTAPATTPASDTIGSDVTVEKPHKSSRSTETVKSTSLTYVDGGEGDRSGNEAALAEARQSLSGVTRVAVRGENSPLLDELRKHVGTFATVDDDASVAINFSGNVEHLGFGRKRRSGSARITRKGHVLFRWELPPQIYRIGDDPADAFGRVAHDLFAQ
jgi:hypothetical protein